MPVYAYECEECGVRFEVRQKFTDAPISVCPECGGHSHRIPQAVGIVFKGSGWYTTDARGRSNLAVPPRRDSDADDGKNGKGDSRPESPPKAPDSSATKQS